MEFIDSMYAEASLLLKIALLAGLAGLAHLVVLLIRRLINVMLQGDRDRRYRKLRSVGTLATSAFIPNRTINNVISYPRGYVRRIVDVTLRGDPGAKQAAESAALSLMEAAHEQFPGILMTEPSNEGRKTLSSGKEILRLKFRIWPNRGQPIEASFVQEMTAELRRIDPDYRPWMIAVTYEVEKRPEVPPQRLWPFAKGGKTGTDRHVSSA